MTQALQGLILTAAALAGSSSTLIQAAEQYEIDATHVAVSFKASHLNLSWTHGRFNDVSGSFSWGADPAKAAFQLKIKADSIDTANAKRDEHLRGPDFFNVKQFPEINFKSAQIKAADDGWLVHGELTIHGQTKPVKFKLTGGKKAEMPPGVHRIGFSTDLTLKRSEFGMDKFLQAVGDDIHIAISFEGIRK